MTLGMRWTWTSLGDDRANGLILPPDRNAVQAGLGRRRHPIPLPTTLLWQTPAPVTLVCAGGWNARRVQAMPVSSAI